ncbi:putative transmembrane protein [Candidatus Burkholderia verschuerenii]|uniref:Putative transmembrane protein n=2 Tax=Candidatus Burkholderia verschuerenii TaxID=242163 RepID=A0A0L0MBH5_9BURK|nr:DUF3025 domain-containing protein [Candidatus Burkholderia verschuerenii]KND59334.1 putative transmembrane protein [Candidatus Burkholderia verschuerenii]
MADVIPANACSPFAAIDWSRPWNAPLAERGARWQSAALAGYAAYLDALNADARAAALVSGRGKPLGFIAQDDLPEGASYEAHIAQTGCVPTRHNLHDFFNGLMWFAQPRIKAALNTRQAMQIDALGIGPTRGGVRDALTLFDENAVLFACADRALADALRRFDWRTLFVTERAGWGTRCEARIFGHALLEKLVAPYKACTGHAWIVEVPDSYFSVDDTARRAMLDALVAERLLSEPLDSRAFSPLPVLGVPGWWDANASADFYDDTSVFRPGRRIR